MTEASKLQDLANKVAGLHIEYEAHVRLHSGKRQIQFEEKTRSLIIEALDLLKADVTANWYRVPSLGVPGSLAQTKSRRYRVQLDDSYVLEISWSDYPDDSGMVLESFRESFSARFVGVREVVTRQGFWGIGRLTTYTDFPLVYIEVAQEPDYRVFLPKSRVQADILRLGQRLREQLG